MFLMLFRCERKCVGDFVNGPREPTTRGRGDGVGEGFDRKAVLVVAALLR